MKRKITWGLLIAATALFSGCDRAADTRTAPTDTTPVVARAGVTTFHESHIDAEIRNMPESLQHLASDPVARAKILEVLIRRKVLSQHALELGLNTDPVIRERIERARDSILIEALQEWQTSRLPQFTSETIEAYYKKHMSEFTIPEQIHARHILVGNEKLAGQIIAKLRRGKGDFATLAATHSLDDSNKARGGDLNWFPRGMMVAPFEKAAFALKEKGDIAGPVKTQFGWHIIELLGKRPASRKSVEEAREEIINTLQQQALQQWLETLMAKEDISIIKPEYMLPANNRAGLGEE